MKAAEFLVALSLAFLLSAGSAYAQDPDEDPGDEGELTIRLIPDPEMGLPDAVTDPIALPEAASGEGVTSEPPGIAIANEARMRRLDGLATATAARADGRLFGENMAAEAQGDRETISPGKATDLPARPDLPKLPPDGPKTA